MQNTDIPFLSECTESQVFIGQATLKQMGVRYSETPYLFNGEVVGFPFNLDDLVNQFGKDLIPEKLGIYHLFYNERLIYIGMSTKLRSRLLGHLKRKLIPFNYVLWFCADQWKYDATVNDVLDIEMRMIQHHIPPFNSRGID
jgi:hypothetical protein